MPQGCGGSGNYYCGGSNMHNSEAFQEGVGALIRTIEGHVPSEKTSQRTSQLNSMSLRTKKL